MPAKKTSQLFFGLYWVLVAACGIFSCGMWDLLPWPGIGPPGKSPKQVSFERQYAYKVPIFVAVQSPSCVWLFVTPWIAACQASLFFIISWSLPKFMSIPSVMPSSHLILWLLLLFLPSIFPTTRDFSNELALRIRWPNYGSFSFSISPSNENSGFTYL